VSQTCNSSEHEVSVSLLAPSAWASSSTQDSSFKHSLVGKLVLTSDYSYFSATIFVVVNSGRLE
jgi:hypothetical protein